MVRQDKIRPMPANVDHSPPSFDGEKISDAYRQRSADEVTAAPMETDGGAGGAVNRPRTNVGSDPGAKARPLTDLPPTQHGAERDRVFPRKGRTTFLVLFVIGLAVAVVVGVFTIT